MLSAIVATFGAMLCGAVVFVHGAHAQTTDCTVTKAQIAQIAAIQNDPTLTPAQELAQELALRKELVSQTITCAEGQVSELQTALENASTTDAMGQSVQLQLLGNLNDASNFYNLQLQKLSDSGIAGTESVAANVLSWRKDTLAPLSETVNNFILWSSNQSLFATAETRLDQTQRAVSFLESANQDADLQTAFDQANASLGDAESENIAARNALAQRLGPDQSLALIKQSLDSLSDTYQDFFNVSTLIKNSLSQ